MNKEAKGTPMNILSEPLRAYINEIEHRIVRTLQAELPNERWDRVQQIVHDNFSNIWKKASELQSGYMKVKKGVETDFTGLPIDPFDSNSWE